MAYKPSLWLMSDLHRRIVAAAGQFQEYSVLLRPARRHIFIRQFQLPKDVYIPEFFRPCFCVLAREKNPDKKPCLVIETVDQDGNRISKEMADLYDQHGILWTLIRQEQHGFVLECWHGGTHICIEERTGSLFKLLAAPLAWFERHVSFPQGSYVHSHSERVLREAVKTLSPSYRIEIHHQVPLSYVLGFKDGLADDEKRLLGSEIDAVIAQSFASDPDGAVVLPVKLDLHDSHRDNPKVGDRDDAVKRLCEKHKVPLLVVTPSADDAYEFECSALGLPKGKASALDPEAWAGSLAPFLGAAIRYAGRSF